MDGANTYLSHGKEHPAGLRFAINIDPVQLTYVSKLHSARNHTHTRTPNVFFFLIHTHFQTYTYTLTIYFFIAWKRDLARYYFQSSVFDVCQLTTPRMHKSHKHAHIQTCTYIFFIAIEINIMWHFYLLLIFPVRLTYVI